MKTIKLGSLITISKGKKHTITDMPSSQSKRVLGIDDLRNDTLIRMTDDQGGVLACENDVLIAWDGANAGTIGYGKQGYIGSTISRLRLHDKSKFYTPFIGIFLQSNFNYLRKTSTGATIPHISRNALESILIPVFEYGDQIRIATLLSKVENLISRRREQLKQLDELLKSVFLERFGDPVRNEKGWEKVACKDVVDILTGYPFKSDSYVDDPTQMRLCGGLIIDPSRIEWGKCNYWPNEIEEGLDRYILESGDIVLAMDRPWISSGLKVGIINEYGAGSLLVQRTARLRGKGLNQFFLYQHFRDHSFAQHCKPTETTVPHISIKDIQTYQLICPAISIQSQFANIVEKVEGIKFHYIQSLTELENLYGVLSQQGFSGKLDLSRVRLVQEGEPISMVSALCNSESLFQKETVAPPV